MRMEFERISVELIKPSSPTPNHLKTYKLSLFDQHMPPIYGCVVFFFPPSYKYKSFLLKQSLSETLSLFHPLAGKIKDALSIDCNDEGLHYTNARVSNISLSDFLNQPDFASLGKLLPQVSSPFEGGFPGSHVLMVQETCFPCGGISIGFLISHLAMDGASWCAICSGKQVHNSTRPFADGSTMFPPVDDFPKLEVSPANLPWLKQGKISATRFVFDTSGIDRLKAKAMNIRNPSRTEVVTALLCKCLKEAQKAKHVAIAYPVNLRRSFDPPLPNYSVGNFAWSVKTKTEDAELETFLCNLREAVRADIENVTKMSKRCGKELLKVDNEKYKRTDEDSETEFIGCTSWVNFSVYEIDFGWGKPLWFCFANVELSNDLETTYMSTITLADANYGKGIEAFVQSNEENICNLEKNEELLSYASVKPSLLTSANPSHRSSL